MIIYVFPLYSYYTTILVSKIPLLLDCMPFTNQINQINESTRSFFNFVSAKLSMFSLGCFRSKSRSFPPHFRPKSCFHYSCPHFKPSKKRSCTSKTWRNPISHTNR